MPHIDGGFYKCFRFRKGDEVSMMSAWTDLIVFLVREIEMGRFEDNNVSITQTQASFDLRSGSVIKKSPLKHIHLGLRTWVVNMNGMIDYWKIDADVDTQLDADELNEICKKKGNIPQQLKSADDEVYGEDIKKRN